MKITKKQVISFIFLLSLSISFIFFNNQVLAQYSSESDIFKSQEGMKEVSYVYGNKRPQDLRLIIARFIRLILSFLGTIFFILTFVAGFKWMTSGGDEAKIKSAKGSLVNSVIGLIIILVSWSITTYIINVLNRLIINQSIDFINM